MWFNPKKGEISAKQKTKKNWAKRIKGFDNFREYMGIYVILNVLLGIFVISKGFFWGGGGAGGDILVMWGCFCQFKNFKYFFSIINFDVFGILFISGREGERERDQK